MSETVLYSGRFVPPEVMADKKYPRLVGDGYLLLDDQGLTVRGRAFDLTNPRALRLKILFTLGLILLGVVQLPAYSDMVLGFGGGWLLSWTLWTWHLDRKGRDLAKRVLWEDVDEARADDQTIAILHGSAVLFGPKLPTPIFFSPDEGVHELMESMERWMERNPQPEHIRPV